MLVPAEGRGLRAAVTPHTKQWHHSGQWLVMFWLRPHLPKESLTPPDTLTPYSGAQDEVFW